MSDHLLWLDAIDEGRAVMSMTCGHEFGADAWRTRWSEGQVEVDDPECWFLSWWDALGGEIVDLKLPPSCSWPIAVKPSDDWGCEEGGAIVYAGEENPHVAD